MIIHIPSEKIGCNSYIIREGKHVIIIDPGQGDEIMDELESRGYIPEYIFLTHEHFDHIENLEKMRSRYNVPVVASELCSEGVQKVSTNLSGIADLLTYFKTGEIPEIKTGRFVCDKADITYDEQFAINWRGHEFRFKRAPGHSPGSVIIMMDDDSVFTGDYVIDGKEEVLRLKGGSEEDFERYTRPVLDSIPAGVHIYPGHGPVYVKGQNNGS